MPGRLSAGNGVAINVLFSRCPPFPILKYPTDSSNSFSAVGGHLFV